MNPPIIFLDFDGVLHPVDYLSFQTVDGELELYGDARLCWANILLQLIENYQCELVVHSSWRLSYSLPEIRAMIPTGLRERILGATKGGNRYDGILAYAKDAQPCAYVILDDMADEFPQPCPELLLCDGTTGVSDNRIQAALNEFLMRACQQFCVSADDS